MDTNIKNVIKQYIDLLSNVKADNKIAENEFKVWIPNCIECLQFALDNEQLLIEKPILYEDTISTLSLLYNWIFKEESWAYIELSEKFKKIYTSEEVGNTFKVVLNKMNEDNKTKELENSLKDFSINCKNSDGEFKSMQQILFELSQQWNEINN